METLTVNGIDGNDSFTVNSLVGVNDLTTVRLNGFNDADSFIVTATPPGGIALNIRGGNQSDTLIGLNAPSTWNITGANQGNITGIVTSFASVENLTGGSDADNFVFEDGDSVTGTIDGGVGTDLLDYTAYTSALGVNLGLSSTGLSATLGADQENPPTTSTATGTATITNYNAVAKTFDISVTVDGSSGGRRHRFPHPSCTGRGQRADHHRFRHRGPGRYRHRLHLQCHRRSAGPTA